jgi:hypothetical protein
MPRKKILTRKSRPTTCEACGRTVSKKSRLISKTFDGFAYNFDSDDCLLIFKKLRSVYGKNFFRKLSA